MTRRTRAIDEPPRVCVATGRTARDQRGAGSRPRRPTPIARPGSSAIPSVRRIRLPARAQAPSRADRGESSEATMTNIQTTVVIQRLLDDDYIHERITEACAGVRDAYRRARRLPPEKRSPARPSTIAFARPQPASPTRRAVRSPSPSPSNSAVPRLVVVILLATGGIVAWAARNQRRGEQAIIPAGAPGTEWSASPTAAQEGEPPTARRPAGENGLDLAWGRRRGRAPPVARGHSGARPAPRAASGGLRWDACRQAADPPWRPAAADRSAAAMARTP
jgi:hypothetical protein